MLSMRPWSLMQLLAAHHAGPAPASLSPHMHALSCNASAADNSGMEISGGPAAGPEKIPGTASRACGLSTFGDWADADSATLRSTLQHVMSGVLDFRSEHAAHHLRGAQLR